MGIEENLKKVGYTKTGNMFRTSDNEYIQMYQNKAVNNKAVVLCDKMGKVLPSQNIIYFTEKTMKKQYASIGELLKDAKINNTSTWRIFEKDEDAALTIFNTMKNYGFSDGFIFDVIYESCYKAHKPSTWHKSALDYFLPIFNVIKAWEIPAEKVESRWFYMSAARLSKFISGNIRKLNPNYKLRGKELARKSKLCDLRADVPDYLHKYLDPNPVCDEVRVRRKDKTLEGEVID